MKKTHTTTSASHQTILSPVYTHEQPNHMNTHTFTTRSLKLLFLFFLFLSISILCSSMLLLLLLLTIYFVFAYTHRVVVVLLFCCRAQNAYQFENEQGDVSVRADVSVHAVDLRHVCVCVSVPYNKCLFRQCHCIHSQRLFTVTIKTTIRGISIHILFLYYFIFHILIQCEFFYQSVFQKKIK